MDSLKEYHESNLLYTEEGIVNCRKDGYHPVCPGDAFQNDRYKPSQVRVGRFFDGLACRGYAVRYLQNTRCILQLKA